MHYVYYVLCILVNNVIRDGDFVTPKAASSNTEISINFSTTPLAINGDINMKTGNAHRSYIYT
jgi:hypothetical protein